MKRDWKIEWSRRRHVENFYTLLCYYLSSLKKISCFRASYDAIKYNTRKGTVIYISTYYVRYKNSLSQGIVDNV